jgi:aspartyl-tRNA(Asn)/glutamyl-tRNA(Gln) amidotransferase subunit B
MEIVSEPEIDSAEEAVAYLNSLRQILIYGGVSDADMEKGQMRADVNISVRPEGQKELGVKIELKNINSMSAIRRAIKAETERQIHILEGHSTEKLVQSTRRWNDDTGETEMMRSKENAHDYRYFPCPDLIPVRTAPLVEKMKPHRPELPYEKCARFEKDFGLTAYDANVLASEQALAAYFESAIQSAPTAPGKKVANWIINELLGSLNETEQSITQCKLPAADLAELVCIIEAGKISNNQAKEVFGEMFAHGGHAVDIIKMKGFEQVSDTGALEAMVDQILASAPEKVAEVKNGNEKALNWFTGQAMKMSGGKANPKLVTEIVRKRVLG